jgi:photosystem II stability/assembly factor-like uncharacterized protein
MRFRLFFLAVGLVFALATVAALAQPPRGTAPAWTAAALRPAVLTPLATRAPLLGVARVSARQLVAVGVRGIVLRSDDDGRSWVQVPAPTSVTLTAVQFVDERHGFAVGHGAVVIGTRDGGRTWQRLLDGSRADGALGPEAATLPAAERPLFALHFDDARRGLVVGAFGLALRTEDGGATWRSVAGSVPNPQSLHLYGVAALDNVRLLVGEQGFAARSVDGGDTFERLSSPYAGSFFGARMLDAGAALVFGMRGSLFNVSEGGRKWAPLAAAGLPAIGGASPLPQGGDASPAIALASHSGALHVSRDGGRTFQFDQATRGAPLSAVVPATDGWIAVGLAGAQRFDDRGRPVSPPPAGGAWR